MEGKEKMCRKNERISKKKKDMKKECRNKEGKENIWRRNEGIRKKKKRYEEGMKE